MRILGIESSCDETAAAIVEDGERLMSNVIASSMALHVPYGGVVPEIAARSHIESIIPVIREALAQAKCSPRDIDGLAVTAGAGLGGSLLIGVMAARTLALTWQKPLYAVNHVLGHVYANFITSTSLPNLLLPTHQPRFPMLAVIVSGGHSQLALFQDHFRYQLLGQTLDDAIGEAFDKVAKLLGLPYPGGPSVGKLAHDGDPTTYTLPHAKLSGRYDFSFSGLKTAVLRLAQKEAGVDITFPSTQLASRLTDTQKANIAASFQYHAVKTIVDKVVTAYTEYSPASVVIAGGVAASPELRRQLSAALPLPIEYTDPKLCTDNGAMIATLGCYMATCAQPLADPYTLTIAPNLTM
jgi:N6-L-threonylcarbamoyladenine synthase